MGNGPPPVQRACFADYARYFLSVVRTALALAVTASVTTFAVAESKDKHFSIVEAASIASMQSVSFISSIA